jgi:hypothetical protein
MSSVERSVQLLLEGSAVATAIFKGGIGVEVWKENELCGTVDHDRLRYLVRLRRPENLVALIEALLERPAMTPASKKELLDFTQDWFRAAHA